MRNAGLDASSVAAIMEGLRASATGAEVRSLAENQMSTQMQIHQLQLASVAEIATLRSELARMEIVGQSRLHKVELEVTEDVATVRNELKQIVTVDHVQLSEELDGLQLKLQNGLHILEADVKLVEERRAVALERVEDRRNESRIQLEAAFNAKILMMETKMLQLGIGSATTIALLCLAAARVFL